MKVNSVLKLALVPVLIWCGFAATGRLSRRAILLRGEQIRRSAIDAHARLNYSHDLTHPTLQGAIDGLVAASLKTNQVSLDAGQAAALRKKLATCIASHSIGTVDDYVRLVTPSTDNFEGWAEPDFMSFKRQAIADEPSNPDWARECAAILGGRDVQSIQDGRELARILRQQSVALGRYWTNPFYCDKCWSGVALNDMTLRLSITPYPPTSILEQARSEGYYGYENCKPNRLVMPTLLQTLRGHGTITVAMFSFAVETREPVERHRIYASFYHSPENEDWILEDFGRGDPTAKWTYEIN